VCNSDECPKLSIGQADSNSTRVFHTSYVLLELKNQAEVMLFYYG